MFQMKSFINQKSKGSNLRSGKFILPGSYSKEYGYIQKGSNASGEFTSSRRIMGGQSSHNLTLYFGEKKYMESDFTEDSSFLDILHICNKFVDIYSVGIKITDGDGREIRNDKDLLAVLVEHEGLQNIDIYVNLNPAAQPLSFKLPQHISGIGSCRNNVDNNQNELSEMEEDLHEQTAEENNNSSIGSSQRKGRGITVGRALQKKTRATGKLDIIVHPRRNRIVGENAKDFKTEACVLIRQLVSYQYPHWKDVPTDMKMKLWLGMKQKFKLTDDLLVKKAVNEQLNRQYRSCRNKLHARYLKHKGTDDIFKQCPTGVSEGDWELLINYFESDDFKKVSDRNKNNRQKLTMHNTCGAKSIAQYCYEERDIETGLEPTRTSIWKKTHFSNKRKDWIDKASRETYEDIVRLQSEPTEESGDVMNEDDAFIKVLGDEKPSRLRGCGDGLKPSLRAGGRINIELQKENEELRKQVEESKECLEVLRTENKGMATRLESLENTIPAIMQSLKQISQVPSSNV